MYSVPGAGARVVSRLLSVDWSVSPVKAGSVEVRSGSTLNKMLSVSRFLSADSESPVRLGVEVRSGSTVNTAAAVPGSGSGSATHAVRMNAMARNMGEM